MAIVHKLRLVRSLKGSPCNGTAQIGHSEDPKPVQARHGGGSLVVCCLGKVCQWYRSASCMCKR